ncbi:MAG: hypothetical protein ACK41Y_16370, partial [Paracoccus hibiscisoli]
MSPALAEHLLLLDAAVAPAAVAPAAVAPAAAAAAAAGAAPAAEWRVGEQFTLVGDAPLNRRPDGSMEGVCSLVYRIRHARAARPLVLKVMISFRQDANLQAATRGMPTLLVKLHSAEFLLPQLAPHLHVVRVLHHFVG